MKRKHINLKTKLASALLALNDISYEDSKSMSAEQIISLYHFDHGILWSTDPIDEPWNLTPRLIKNHRNKSKNDIKIIAKSRRIDKKWGDFMSAISKGIKPSKRISKWPKRKFRS